jgi:hypothetical protein
MGQEDDDARALGKPATANQAVGAVVQSLAFSKPGFVAPWPAMPTWANKGNVEMSARTDTSTCAADRPCQALTPLSCL